jgi:hypothetical protein
VRRQVSEAPIRITIRQIRLREAAAIERLAYSTVDGSMPFQQIEGRLIDVPSGLDSMTALLAADVMCVEWNGCLTART